MRGVELAQKKVGVAGFEPNYSTTKIEN